MSFTNSYIKLAATDKNKFPSNDGPNQSQKKGPSLFGALKPKEPIPSEPYSPEITIPMSKPLSMTDLPPVFSSTPREYDETPSKSGVMSSIGNAIS